VALRGKGVGSSPRALLLGLEQLLNGVVLDAELAPAAKAHAAAQVHAVLVGERAYQAEAAGLGRFAQWAARELPAGEGRVVRDAVAWYVGELRMGVALVMPGVST